MRDDYYEQDYTMFEEELLGTIQNLETRIWELENELENAMERICELEEIIDDQASNYSDSFVE